MHKENVIYTLPKYAVLATRKNKILSSINTVRDRKVDQADDNVGRRRVLKEVGSEEGRKREETNSNFSQMQTRFKCKHIFIFFTWVYIYT